MWFSIESQNKIHFLYYQVFSNATQAIKAILILVNLCRVYAFSILHRELQRGTLCGSLSDQPTGFLWLHTISIGASGWHSHLGFGKLLQLYLRDRSVTNKQLEFTVNAL